MVRKDRSGDDLRDIKSGGGNTTFKVVFEMLEERKPEEKSVIETNPTDLNLSPEE